MEMDKTVMIQVKCKGMKKSEMHIVSYSDGTEVNRMLLVMIIMTMMTM